MCLAPGDERFTPSQLRRHLLLWCGAEVANGGTFAELAAGVARVGGRVMRRTLKGRTQTVFAGVNMITPSLSALRKRWRALLEDDGLAEEPPAIRRPTRTVNLVNIDDTGEGVYRSDSDGVWRQVRDLDEMAYTHSQTRNSGRAPRFIKYAEAMTRYLHLCDAAGAWRRFPFYDRTVVAMAAQGCRWREMRERLGIGQSRIQEALHRHWKLAGVAGRGRDGCTTGPGRGR